ncbi:MAG TPA: hypothetical protein VM536_14380, partial [Chloroflexia bacterium]|nr:hypothetical protein [Chloroflexia bacterium]
MGHRMGCTEWTLGGGTPPRPYDRAASLDRIPRNRQPTPHQRAAHTAFCATPAILYSVIEKPAPATGRRYCQRRID